MTERLDQRFASLKRDGRSALVAAVFATFAASCASPARAELSHLGDMPSFEGGRVLDNCELSVEQQQEMNGSEYRCVVISRAEASDHLRSYFQSLRARGWTQGGSAGSAVWVLIPLSAECAQLFGIVASDYPRGARTSETSELVLDFVLEQRMRCGDERNLQ